MGILDDVFDTGLNIGSNLAGGGGIETSKSRKTTIQQAFEPRRVVYGTHLITPSLVYVDTLKRYNRFLLQRFVVASQLSSKVKAVYFNDELAMEETSSDPFSIGITASNTDYAGFLTGYVRRGFDVENLTNDDGAGWTETRHHLNGQTVLNLKLEYHTKLWVDGIPRVTCLLEGKVLFDPRTDETVYSDNYALCVLDWLMTMVGVDASAIDMDSFINGANISDELVPTNTEQNTEKRYTVSGILELDKTPLENLETLLDSGGGTLSYVQGKWILNMAVYTEPVLDLNESDLISRISFHPNSGKKTRINIAKGSYISPENDWERVDVPAMSVTEYIENDGEKLEATFDYDLVSSGYQVQRLNKIKLERSRYGISLTAIFKFKALKVKVEDRVTLSVSALGWTNKVFRVLETEINYLEGVKLVLREDSSTIYDWDIGDALEISAPPTLSLPDYSDIDPPESFSLTEELYFTNISRDIKVRAFLTWNEEEGAAHDYDVQVQENQTGDWVPLVWRHYTNTLVVNDFKPGTHNFRVRIVSPSGFESDWYESTHEVLGKTAPPPDLEALYIDGGLLTWTYPDAPPDLAGFEARVHDGTRQTWADALPMHTGVISGSRFTLPSNNSGTKTFLVKAIDTTGNYSDNAAVVTIGLGDAETQNVILTEDYKADTWPGTITNGNINGSNEIESDQVGAFYNPDSNSIFYNQDGTSDFYESEFKKLTYEFTYTVLSADVGSQLTIDATVTADSYQLEFIAPSNTSSTYSSFGGYIQRAEEGQYKFRLSIPSQFGSTVPTIESLLLNLDVPDITESFEDLSISSGGTRLPITKTYRGIRHVTLTLQTDGSGAASLKVDDKDETLGPLIYAYNSSGTAVATTIDAFIRGY